jgi:hypothetical protein
MIHQDLPHDARAHAEEMRAVTPASRLPIDEAGVRLAHEILLLLKTPG